MAHLYIDVFWLFTYYINMVILHSYVKYPEGNIIIIIGTI